MEWMQALNRALSYIEEHLTDELEIASVARDVHFSAGTLQRVFSAMTGMSLADYIRARRLSAAGQMLQATDAKVIDVALVYGYETPESFQKAFRRFHGITPSAAKRTRVQLRYLNPMQIHLELKGGSIMDYQIEDIPQLTVIGKEWRVSYDNAFGTVPGLWCEYGNQGLWDVNPGYLGLCFDDEGGKEFTYMIGCFADPEKDKAPDKEGFVMRTLPAATWAKFKAVGKTPQGIQKVNRQVYTEWLPNNPDYELASGCNIEVYSEGDMDSDDYECEFWIPVKKK